MKRLPSAVLFDAHVRVLADLTGAFDIPLVQIRDDPDLHVGVLLGDLHQVVAARPNPDAGQADGVAGIALGENARSTRHCNSADSDTAQEVTPLKIHLAHESTFHAIISAPGAKPRGRFGAGS